MTSDRISSDLIKENRELRAEVGRLQNTLKLHAGDCQSLNGEVTMFKERAEAAEADNERLQALLFRLRNYIAGEHTLDRPKDAMLEQIDAALKTCIHKP